MNLINCDNLEIIKTRTYGGATGSKIAVVYNNEVYMLKTSQNLKNRNFKNVEISYANDCISEYIGSHIYEIFNIPVHKTLLGTYKNKMCVLCKDLAYPDYIREFKTLRNALMDENIIQPSSGMSTELSDIYEVIDNTSALNKDQVYYRFYTMFVIDALIGNADRNNGNWGFKIINDRYVLEDVYDNGGCLNNKKSDEQLIDILKDNKRLDSIALEYTFNYTQNGKRINPFHFIKNNMDKSGIYETIDLIVKTDFHDIDIMLSDLSNIISEKRIKYYSMVMWKRFLELKRINEEFKDNQSAKDRLVNIAKF